MKIIARVLCAVLAVTWLAPASALADHNPHLDVECPTGRADIVIDPGHGGPDPGAIRTDPDLVERDLVLHISRTLASLLEDETGLTVALTRDDNETELGNSERGEIANACGALVFIEVHLNAASDPLINRAQAFWGEKEKDLALAKVMNDALGSLGVPVADVDRFDNGGLLRARMPGVLVEAVFLSNHEEAGLLQQGNRQDEIARVIADGVIDWLQLTGAIAPGLDGSKR